MNVRADTIATADNVPADTIATADGVRVAI
jgi:hypothetical protein